MRTGEIVRRIGRALPGIAASMGRRAAGLRTHAIAGLLALVFGGFALSGATFAQQGDPKLGEILSAPSVGSNEPMLLQADEMIYDNDNNKITAKGNVEIYYGNYTLLAERVVYDRGTNTLKAAGNVSIKDPDGAVITADNITLTDDFRDGFIDALKLVTQDDTRIVANSASREAGNVTVFKDGWFTPCKLCEDRPEKPPTWRIRAQKITHKRDQATITYKNAYFDFLGVPVVWVPYFQSADPTVKRKSGFLMPSYGNSDQLGSVVQVPYYFALSENYDFTFAPMVTEKEGTVLLGNWRQRVASGGYHVELAGVVHNPGDESPADEDFRGSIKTAGKFALNPYWGYGWDILAETDDTFRRFYNLDTKLKTDRVSQVFLEGLHDRNYMSTRFYETGNLLLTDEPSAQAWILPVVDYDYIVNQPILGGELSFNANAMNFNSGDEGPNSSRMIAQAQWRRQMIDGIGQVYTPFAQLRGDVYDVSGFTVADTTSPLGNNFEGPINPNSVEIDSNPVRGNAVGGMEYRYPFVATTGNMTHILEPIGQIIARPNDIGNQGDIPNQDAISLVFDDTILFDIDKFSGYDRIETGTRANVGLRYTAQLYNGAYARWVFGESYQLAGDNPYNAQTGAGLDTDRSDYVTGIYVQANSNLSFVAQSRLDEDNLDIQRTDLGSSANYGPVTVAVNYAEAAAQPGLEQQGLGVNEDRAEIRTAGALALTERWALLGQIRYDLEEDRRLTDAVGLRYQDDCFMLSVQYAQSEIKDRDIEPEQTIMLNFSLKYLGTYSVQSEVMGMVGPDGSDLDNP